jgi:predicted GNAT family acetyltransferase
MWTSKIYSRIAAILLLSLASAPQVWAQESGGEIDSFNRSLALEGMGTDLASVEHELQHGTPVNPPESSTTQNPKKGPAQKKAPIQPTESFSNLAFHPSPAVTNSVRAFYLSHLNAQTQLTAPNYDSMISRFDERFASYGFSRHNIGDTVAAYMIIAWEIVHNADASNTPTGIRRVRTAVCQILEKRGKAARLTSENKQKISELLKCVAELCAQQARQARQTSNAAAMQQAENVVTQFPRNLGIDLRRFQLTDNGFVNG